jgi:hypothetical protein
MTLTPSGRTALAPWIAIRVRPFRVHAAAAEIDDQGRPAPGSRVDRPPRGTRSSSTMDRPPRRRTAQMAEMLIDRYLPAFDTTIVEHTVVDADVAVTWSALTDLDLMRVHTPLLDAAMFLRAVPERIAARSGRQRPEPAAPVELKVGADGPGLDGWLSLGQIAQQEVAFGAVGRFWQADITWYDVTAMSPEDFATFDTPGWGRIAANFSLRPYGATRTLASYEARTATSDADTARRFARYWRLVRPFVGYIMRAALSTLAEDAAALARPTSRTALADRDARPTPPPTASATVGRDREPADDRRDDGRGHGHDAHRRA